MQLAHDLLPDATEMGPVTLAVADLDRMIAFYHGGLGLTVLAQAQGTAVLGRRGIPTLRLDQDGTLAHAPATAAGLYHTAFLFDTAADLASAVNSVAHHPTAMYQGAADHLVSEAFYFGDPEGNGVEMYVDRPRDQWQIGPHGEVEMGTLHLDPNRYLRDNLTESGARSVADTPARVGHVHLKVGDLATARQFYVDTLGFAVTASYGQQALFVSAGGYHHHVGMNTWESRGAGERSPALGLGEVTIELPDHDAVGALAERVRDRGIAQAFDGAELTVHDPWRNRIRVTSATDAG
ncbi:Glyoxalase family protein [Leucobacter sp. 7(1)]|uniref:VOC family protein n=1 Tax=Leucobacter sp. 7(1) TaxID=1255613 RepID=UPI00097E81FE|nr:VOC family protein [Leucobacter sp. 7(1)]SJN11057.1 Glyoxalase family protein [Leucobacter sp. 7(1)]